MLSVPGHFIGILLKKFCKRPSCYERQNRRYIVTASIKFTKYTAGYTLDSFLEDRKTQDAVVRNLEVIGQTLKDYGIDKLIEKRPGIPWSQIAGMRNILAHDYLGIDMVMIWDTVQLHLNVLRQALEGIKD